MKYLRLLCLLFVTTFVAVSFGQKPKEKYKYGVYMAGVSASFTDSLVFFTGIQLVDSAAVNKNDMLAGRAQYSMQLKGYVEEHQNVTNRTCFVYFNRKKKKLQKEINKLKEKYQRNQSLVLKEVNPEFKFVKAELY